MVALESLPICAYYTDMSDPRMPTLDRIKADLAESEADIAAGRLIPADAVHQMMQDRIDRLEARLAGVNAGRNPHIFAATSISVGI